MTTEERLAAIEAELRELRARDARRDSEHVSLLDVNQLAEKFRHEFLAPQTKVDLLRVG